MTNTPRNEKLEISEKALDDVLKQIQRAYDNPSRTQEADNILVAVERTLHWVKEGAKGKLLDLTAYSIREVIVKYPKSRPELHTD